MKQLERDQLAAYLTLAGLSEASVRNYCALYLRWCDWSIAAGRDPARLDPLAVRAWAAQLPGGRSLRAQARAVIGHACRATGQADTSAAIPLPRHPRPASRALPPAQAAQLVAAAHRAGLAGVAVLVALYTAARRSEVASLSWRRVDLGARTVILERPKTRDLHRVPLHSQLAEVLEPRRVPGERWVFPGRHGGHVAPATVWSWVGEVAEAAGLERVTPHQLRHTALTVANDATGDLRAVQTLAGHTDPAQTALYTRASSEAVARAVAAISY